MPAEHQTSPVEVTCDIAIIGAGPVGLALAASLRGSGLDVILVERQERAALSDPAFDGREIALSQPTCDLLDKIGAWSRIDASDKAPLRGAKVINGRSDRCLHFDPGLSGAGELGYIVPNHAIRKALWDVFADSGDAQLIDGCTVTATGRNGTSPWLLLDDGRRILPRLLVAADTRFSATRRSMGIAASMHDFGKTMIVSRMRLERDHHHVAWECFLPGGAIAVLPLNDRQASLVVTLDPEDAARRMEMPLPDYANEIGQRLEHRFGALEPVSDRIAYPLVGVWANAFVQPGFALAGDAAVGMHPVTAHGFNLGAQGQAILAEEVLRAVAAGRSPACPKALRRYQARHRRLSAPLYWPTVALAELYARETPAANLARSALLDAGRLLKPARRAIVNSLTGRPQFTLPELPRLRRAS